MNRWKNDVNEILNYITWAVQFAILLEGDNREKFVSDIKTVVEAYLLAIRKFQFPGSLFGDPFKAARTVARTIKAKWDNLIS